MQGICLPSPGNHKSLPSPLTPLPFSFLPFFLSPLSPFPLILRVVIIIFCPFRSPLLPPLLQSVSLCCFHIPFYLQLSSFCSCHFLLSPCIFYPPPLFMRCTPIASLWFILQIPPLCASPPRTPFCCCQLRVPAAWVPGSCGQGWLARPEGQGQGVGSAGQPCCSPGWPGRVGVAL